MHLVKQHGLGIVFALQFPHPLNLIKSRKLSSKFVESNAETQKEKGPNIICHVGGTVVSNSLRISRDIFSFLFSLKIFQG